MSITKFSSEEFVSMVEAKVVDGVIMLEDISQIISDDRFPEHLTPKAIKKLKEYSPDYVNYIYLKKNFLKPAQDIIKLQNDKIKESRKRRAEFKRTKNPKFLIFEEDEQFNLKIAQLMIESEKTFSEFHMLMSIFLKVRKE